MRIISGIYRSRQLRPLQKETNIRPVRDSVRESTFNMITSLPDWEWPGIKVCDLFAGTGALGLEALSRGAGHVTFVDNTYENITLIQRNIKHLNVKTGSTTLLHTDALTYTVPPITHLIFLDPPYALGKLPPFSVLGALYVLFSHPDLGLDENISTLKDRLFGKTRVRLLKAPQAA